jgi:hypothetical protein
VKAALLEHDFIFQYKKGTNMPADYLSRLATLKIVAIQNAVAAFDPFNQT